MATKGGVPEFELNIMVKTHDGSNKGGWLQKTKQKTWLIIPCQNLKK